MTGAELLTLLPGARVVGTLPASITGVSFDSRTTSPGDLFVALAGPKQDGHAYVALVTLKNTNGGQTQFISIALTRFLRFLLYPLYAVPQVFSIFPRRAVTAQAGDLLVMRGARTLHRGITLSDEGERVLLAYTFDPPDKKPNPFRDGIAKRLNY